MDITGIGGSVATASTGTAVAAQYAVLKKVMDIQAQSALQLIQAATASMATYNNPPNLGNRVDTYA